MRFQEAKKWLVVCDGAKARFYRYHQNKLDSVFDQELEADHRLTHEVGRDKPGRGFGTDHVSRQAYEPHSDWHERQKEKMAEKISEILDTAQRNKEYESLIVIAPSKFLGILHNTTLYSKHVHSKVEEEIHKDLIHFNDNEILEYIQELKKKA